MEENIYELNTMLKYVNKDSVVSKTILRKKRDTICFLS